MDEECMVCHEPTGKAGRDEDSLYTPNGIGPFCEQCWDDAWPVMVPPAPDPALLALDARDRRALNALCSLGVAASTDAVFRKVASAALAAWACGGDAVAAIHKAFDDIGTTTEADPMTRLAGLGALVTQYHYGEGLARPFWLPVSGVRLDNMASLARVTEGDSLAPGIASAIAALLVPDAGEVGND